MLEKIILEDRKKENPDLQENELEKTKFELSEMVDSQLENIIINKILTKIDLNLFTKRFFISQMGLLWQLIFWKKAGPEKFISSPGNFTKVLFIEKIIKGNKVLLEEIRARDEEISRELYLQSRFIFFWFIGAVILIAIHFFTVLLPEMQESTRALQNLENNFN